MLFWSGYVGPFVNDGYLYPSGYNNAQTLENASESNVEILMLSDFSVNDLRAHLGASLSQDVTITLRKNQSNQSMTLTITSGNTVGLYSGSISGVAGDRLSMRVDMANSPSGGGQIHVVTGLSF